MKEKTSSTPWSRLESWNILQVTQGHWCPASLYCWETIHWSDVMAADQVPWQTVTAQFLCLSLLKSKENSGAFIAGLIPVDLCATYWYCPVLLLDSLVSTKTENKVTDQGLGLPFLEIREDFKNHYLKRFVTLEQRSICILWSYSLSVTSCKRMEGSKKLK